MALYQKSVLKNHVSQLDTNKVEKAYKKYVKHFLNPTIQDNIRKSKEEEYQGIFLTDLFVNILDYTLKPNADFNLVAEYKNQNNSRKADGAILSNNNAIAVIELKSTKTKDLESIRKQAFDYKVNQKECIYVITSNYEKLRFYINDATEFEEFNLFELSKDRFELLYLCLHKDNLLNNLPLQIKEASIVVEEQITNQFYKDYSLFKRELYRDLVKRNAKQLKSNSTVIDKNDIEAKTEQLKLEKNVKLTLFQKSQKLIDRYLFIFFAEDRGLLPPNSTQQILDKWKADIDFGDVRPLYGLFKQYFTFLDTGRKGTTARAEIYAYNGGLFKQDPVLDSLDIDSELLFNHTKKLAAYDFESQVDVNILGHIFENSLNEIESVNAEIQGGEFDKQKSKRKKDGVFYTPKYITKYIVENTIGKLCTEKKTELGFKEDEYFKGRKNRNKNTIENLVSILDIYRDWLLQLTICDPACGSGAFLNQALDFLIKEHNYIDELKTKILGGGFVFPDIENTILENNIYGVDLNEESVEIAKLSLWLRTAQPRRKLNDLSSNIKCGNSLIDNKSVAGNKAFNWQTQFPKVFEKGGFDVIIGNPPYVRSRELFSEDEKNYYLKKYITTSYQLDLYKLFIEKSCLLIKQTGKISFITPSVFLTNDYDKPLREFIINRYSLEIVASSDKDIFNDASVKTVTFVISSFKENNFIEFYKIDKSEFHFEKKILQKSFIEQDYLINEKLDSFAIPILKKLQKFKKIGDYFDIKNGIKVRKDLLFNSKKDSFHKPFILGKNIFEYYNTYDELYIDYKPENEKKFTNQAFRTKDIFEQEKLITRQILGKRIMTCFDDKYFYTDQTTYVINKKDDKQYLKYLLCVINSKLTYYYFTNTSSDNKVTFPKVKRSQLLELPYNPITEQNAFIKLSNEKINAVNTFKTNSGKFIKYLISQYSLEKLSKKLQNWHELEFGDFIKELNKAIKSNNKELLKADLQPVPVLTKKDEFEWLDLFEENKQKAQDLQNQINQTDKEIDTMVYALYGLTDEEIQIVENS
ncbi:Eco57I restriction-modification methylase domain-containing protein [Wenyingzhuangia sp. 2_MG-2023]|uniref:Eco57I restriction-modification methylase domain-containing protein n=1 Tax=Wenyingzhuangia sp. 2_MG-2023 TaxID=3062639 RepID=UPI0026E2F4D9|nr:TaqI-like C-terminal specificity domain-containing protein [Wenyingzhuangia sp. 2_MG-2023]MDO6739010.1 TaqI-like C-terminal specificity domain-containing protein [Wenyingzhuangia sp. 2_MG-2023]